MVRAAFSGVGLMRKSILPEYLGKPCQDTARAPTRRNSTLLECKHPINSRESFVKAIWEVSLLNCEEDFDTLMGGHGMASFDVRLIGVLKTFENSDDFLHTLF